MLHEGDVMSSPLNVIVPDVGSSILFRQRRNVDFPEPDGPITAIFSPFTIDVLIPLRTCSSVPSGRTKVLRRSFTSITAMLLPPAPA